MTVVECDARDCAHEPFRSHSVPAVIPKQLEEAHWTVIEVRDPKTGDRQIKYLCPGHKPRSRMEGGPPPLSVAGRASH